MSEREHTKRLAAPGADARELAEKGNMYPVAKAWLHEHFPQHIIFRDDKDVVSLAALLESFRAATLEQVCEASCSLCARHIPLAETSMGKFTHLDPSAWSVCAAKHIRALTPDPNWLARQIAEAKIKHCDEIPHYSGCATLLAVRDPYPPCDCWVGAHRAALESTKSKLEGGK